MIGVGLPVKVLLPRDRSLFRSSKITVYGRVTQMGSTIKFVLSNTGFSSEREALEKHVSSLVGRPNQENAKRAWAPYGMWTEGSGRQVLFDRAYRPMWQKLPDGLVYPAHPFEWVNFEEQEWFFDDGNPPWRNRKTRDLCSRVLDEFGVNTFETGAVPVFGALKPERK